jgi:uncharacterized membrane protein YoaK (UPF0700 family)
VHQRSDFPSMVLGGCLLSFNSGVVNAVAILITGLTISHNTGTTGKLGINIGQGKWEEAFQFASLIFSFLLGSMISGFFIRSEKFHPNRKYGLLILFESALLIAMCLTLPNTNPSSNGWSEFLSLSLGSMSFGLQNALCTNLTGAVVRTTHVTGLLTDIGLILGRWLRGRKDESTADLWKLRLLVPIFLGFVSGSAFGALLFLYERKWVILWVVGFLFILGLTWVQYRAKVSFLLAHEGYSGSFGLIEIRRIDVNLLIYD